MIKSKSSSNLVKSCKKKYSFKQMFLYLINLKLYLVTDPYQTTRDPHYIHNMRGSSMVLIVGGSSEHVAHTWRKIGLLERKKIWFSFRKDLFSFMCAQHVLSYHRIYVPCEHCSFLLSSLYNVHIFGYYVPHYKVNEYMHKGSRKKVSFIVAWPLKPYHPFPPPRA